MRSTTPPSCSRGGRCLESEAETASLRLFGPVREAAGRGEDSFDAKTVEELLLLATRRYPPAFEAVLGRCRIWVNGEEVSPGHQISADDEVAIIPPVSGG
jgi:molybdopterin converting factor small subunit